MNRTPNTIKTSKSGEARPGGNRKLIVAAATAAATLGVYAIFGGSPAPTVAGPDAAPRADLIDAAFDRLLAQAQAADELKSAATSEAFAPVDSPAAPAEADDDGWESLPAFNILGNPFASRTPEPASPVAESVAELEPVSEPVAEAPPPEAEPVELPPFDLEEPVAAEPDAAAQEAMDLLDALITGEELPVESAEADVFDVTAEPATVDAVSDAVAAIEVDVQPTPEPEPAAEPIATPEPIEPVVEAEQPPVDVEIIAGGQLREGAMLVTVNDSRIIETTRPFHRVAIAKDSLATIQPISPTQLLVTAHEAGTTQVVFWDEWDQSQTFLLQSGTDLRVVQQMLERLLPGEDIQAVDLGGRIGLSGTVSDLDVASQAERIASAYGEVENFMTIAGKQQVALRIVFAEVARTAGKEFGVNFGFDDGTGTVFGSNIGQIRSLGFNDTATGIGVPDPTAGVQLFGLGSLAGDPFAYYVNALRDSNLLKVLAEPELVVMSGMEGEFLAGGEYPVPVPQEEGIAIEYKEYGVKLTYQPIALGDGRIQLRLATEVSDLDDSVGVSSGGTRVPGLSTRAAATVVELREGQTLAIGGLLQSKAIASKSSVPLLGDIPLLGAAFRSVRYSRQETELVIMITPRLAEATDPGVTPPPPGSTWRHPSDVELMLFGQLGGDAGVSLPDDADRDGSDNLSQGHPRPGPGLQSRYAFTPAGE